MDIIDQCKNHTISTAKERGNNKRILEHISSVKKWAEFLLKHHVEADREVVVSAVWLHDIGRLVGDKQTDHAVNSEVESKRFLTAKVDQPKLDAILHCVRAHRCADVQPKTVEAKIIAAADSAGHMTDIVYADMMFNGLGKQEALKKIERDCRDINAFPELQEKLSQLYTSWKQLIESVPNF